MLKLNIESDEEEKKKEKKETGALGVLIPLKKVDDRVNYAAGELVYDLVC